MGGVTVTNDGSISLSQPPGDTVERIVVVADGIIVGVLKHLVGEAILSGM